MKPLIYKREGNLLTFGLYERLMHKLIHFLNSRFEARLERLWDS